MAETQNNIEAMEQEAVLEANAANPQADAPKKNAVKSEPTALKNDAEDLGPAVVKPTDSNPDATKKQKKFLEILNKKLKVQLTLCLS
jgi:hypothetical protein